MSIDFNLKQSELLVYFIKIALIHWTFESKRKKAIEAASATSSRNRLLIRLSNYCWAGISNYVYNTILVITGIHIFLFL